MNIGGNNNQFINCQVENSGRAGGAVYNTVLGTITYDNYTFTVANDGKTTTCKVPILMTIQVPHLVCQ